MNPATGTKQRLILTGVLIFFMITQFAFSQDQEEAMQYLDAVMGKNQQIATSTWEYISASAHTKNLRDIENKRKQVASTLKTALDEVQRSALFQKDKKMDEARDEFEKIVADYAARNNIKLVTKASELSEKLKKAGQVIDYYNEIYLVFFKSFKQDYYLTQAAEKGNVNEIEQNRSTLRKYAEEGLKKCKNFKAFDRDASLKDICIKVLEYYKKESEKYKIFTDYYMKMEAFNEYKTAFEQKKESDLTQKDVDKYNSLVGDLNEATEACNKTGEELNKEGKKLIEEWNKKSDSFMGKHVPK